jgi:hypothetical protein
VSELRPPSAARQLLRAARAAAAAAASLALKLALGGALLAAMVRPSRALLMSAPPPPAAAPAAAATAAGSGGSSGRRAVLQPLRDLPAEELQQLAAAVLRRHFPDPLWMPVPAVQPPPQQQQLQQGGAADPPAVYQVRAQGPREQAAGNSLPAAAAQAKAEAEAAAGCSGAPSTAAPDPTHPQPLLPPPCPPPQVIVDRSGEVYGCSPASAAALASHQDLPLTAALRGPKAGEAQRRYLQVRGGRWGGGWRLSWQAAGRSWAGGPAAGRWPLLPARSSQQPATPNTAQLTRQLLPSCSRWRPSPRAPRPGAPSGQAWPPGWATPPRRRAR